jgi:hypothetical protein
LTSFMKAELKVVTVGLNPSSAEFPIAEPMSRFPTAAGLAAGAESLSEEQVDTYLASLSSYFHQKPYRRWFDASYGGLLDGLRSSYYGGANTAIHTDLCSPLATQPTWSGLDQEDRQKLQASGTPLWHQLLDFLEPDVALVSVARDHLEAIRFPIASPSQTVHTVSRMRPYEVTATARQLKSGKQCLFVFGRASQTPFGTISSTDKRNAGRSVFDMLHG